MGRERGFLAQIRDNRYIPIAVPNPSHSLAINALARDATGALWIASTGDGLYRQEGLNWKRNGDLPHLPAAPPVSISSDQEQRLWMGYVDDQLFSVDAAMHVHRFGRSDGLHVGAVLAVAVRDHRVWVAGTEGVSLLNNEHFATLRNIDGAPFINTSGIVEDFLGGLWLNGGDGVTHISASEINAFIDDHDHLINKEVMNSEDGLREYAPLLRPLPTA